jgi:hypothetical protein
VVELAITTTTTSPLGDEGAIVGKLLDAVLECIRNKDVPRSIDCYCKGVVELAITTTPASPVGDEGAIIGKLLDAVVLSVSDKDIP